MEDFISLRDLNLYLTAEDEFVGQGEKEVTVDRYGEKKMSGRNIELPKKRKSSGGILTDEQRRNWSAATQKHKELEARGEDEKVLEGYRNASSVGVLDLLFNRILEMGLLEKLAASVNKREVIHLSFDRVKGEFDPEKAPVDVYTDCFIRIYIGQVTNGIAMWRIQCSPQPIERAEGEFLSKFYYIRRDGEVVKLNKI
jgi:hypothetical protein